MCPMYELLGDHVLSIINAQAFNKREKENAINYSILL